jgi:LCP family protein required for cell wall assembly
MDKINLKTLKIVIFSLLGATFVLAIGYSLIFWNRPLSEPLDLPTETQEVKNITTAPSATVEEGDPPTITPTPTIEPVCGGPLSMNIVISGVASKGYLYGLADAIRVVRIDFQEQDVVVLALPRDLWVSIPGIEDQGISEGKLNQAYFYGTEGMGYYSGAGYGSGLLAETLLENFGYRADHYVAVNLYSFRRIIDALGGIDIYLAGDSFIKSYGQPKLFLKAGSHHINGYQAEMLARNRISIGDYGRINNQTVILRAVAARLVSPAGIKAIPNLIDQFFDNVLTDLSPDQISQLICLAGMIDQKEDINFYTLPEDLVSEERIYDSAREIYTYALTGDEEQIREFLEAFQRGDWPEE